MNIHMKLIIFFFAILSLKTDLIFTQTEYNYPKPMKVDHTDNYFGNLVSDPYVWMEEMQSTEVKNWVSEENQLTESYLNKIPFRHKIRERITELWNYPRYSAPFQAGVYYFFSKNDGLQNQSVLYRQKGLDGSPEIFLDPNKLSANGTVSIGGTSVSWDNKYYAYSINRAGSDWTEIFVMNIETKEKLKDSLNWVKFSGISWHNDGFYYNRYDEVEGDKLKTKNQSPKIYFHRIGTEQNEDQLIYEDKENSERSFSIFTTEDQTYLFRSEWQKGSRGNKLSFLDLRKAGFNYIPISENFENSFSVISSEDDAIYIKTNKDAPKNKIVKFTPSTNESADIVPENSNVMNSISFVDGKFTVQYMKDAYEIVYIYDKHGNFENEIKLPTIGSVSGLNGRKSFKEVFYTFTSFTYPPAIYKYDLENKSTVVFRETEVNFNPKDYESRQVFYGSTGGAMIPMFLVYKKGLQLNGNNPTLLYGYGGFNVSQTPSFSATKILFLENGGVYALACLRGGGEYGEEWHKAGMQLNKQNVFDDFIMAAEYLITEKYTTQEKLAIQGGSNGGLLVGAVINQRPELFKVALPAVGVMDMLKYHKFTIGWAWVTDYGSSEDSIHFKNLYSYSPLHNIKNQKYPATFITTSDHDDRVVPLHSYKYAATLQEKNTSDNPILLRVETEAGHGAGKPITKLIDEQTDIWSFLFYNLGIELN